MPYKDKEVQKQKNKDYQKKHYKSNKAYYKEKAKERRQELKDWYKDLKNTLKCSMCPEDDPVCLDFHHRNPKEKEIGLSQVVRKGWGKNRILEEIKKCDVLCSNCHKKLHTKILTAG